MRKLAFAGIVLQPTASSFVIVGSTTFLVLFNTIVNFGGSNDQLFRILLGSDSSPELIDTTKTMVGGFTEMIFDNPTINKLLFFVFWIFVGLVVYIFVNGAGSSIDAAQKLKEDESLLHAHKNKLEQEFILRLVLRFTALSAWLIYSVIFMKLFLPFSTLSFQVAVGGGLNVNTIFYGIFGAVVLLLTLHLHIVLLRCFLLRPRIIGGWEDVLITSHLT